ncbi:Exonuclease SbcC [Actinacidiphila bryophytorum]|uniref:Exonuclease SbcC n=1 Tax=Actinacidiphila bryophytorum TaxID=1436133 RepID=A0A9W4E5L4_9ACTN|nr:Exonuclease SbcC [Actinacidiphila bryophytorum]
MARAAAADPAAQRPPRRPVGGARLDVRAAAGAAGQPGARRRTPPARRGPPGVRHLTPPVTARGTWHPPPRHHT